MAAVSLVRVYRWREGAEAARRALRLSPWDLSSAIYDGVAAYAAYVERRLRRGDPAIARGHPSAQRRRRHIAAAAMAGEMDLAKAMLQELRAAHSPTFHWPGWRATFPSGEMSVNIFWKACAAAASHQ